LNSEDRLITRNDVYGHLTVPVSHPAAGTIMLSFSRKCHHCCFCCNWSLIPWHFSALYCFSQLQLFSSASHGHKNSEHSCHLYISMFGWNWIAKSL